MDCLLQGRPLHPMGLLFFFLGFHVFLPQLVNSASDPSKVGGEEDGEKGTWKFLLQ